jgi:hypothetical protein
VTWTSAEISQFERATQGDSTDEEDLLFAFTGNYPRKDSAEKTFLPQTVTSKNDKGVTVQFVSDLSFGGVGFRCMYTTSLEASWIRNYENSTLNQRLLIGNIAEDVCGGGTCADFQPLLAGHEYIWARARAQAFVCACGCVCGFVCLRVCARDHGAHACLPAFSCVTVRAPSPARVQTPVRWWARP